MSSRKLKKKRLPVSSSASNGNNFPDFWQVVLFLFFFSTPLIFWSKFETSGNLISTQYAWPKFYYILSFALLIIGGYCLYLLYSPQERLFCGKFIRQSKTLRGLLLLLLLMALSIPGALVKPASWLVFIDYLVLFGLWLVLANLLTRSARRWAVIYGLFAAQSIVVILGFIQFFGIELPFIMPMDKDGFRVVGATFGYYTVLAHFLVINFPFQVAVVYDLRRKLQRKFTWLKNLALVWGWLLVCSVPILVLVIASRIGILIMLLELLLLAAFGGVILWRRRRAGVGSFRGFSKRRFVVVATVVALMLVLVLSGVVWQNSGNRRGGDKNQIAWLSQRYQSWSLFYRQSLADGKQSFTPERLFTKGRYYPWRNTLNMVKDFPGLGVGVGNWNFRYPYYHQSYRSEGFYYNLRMYKTHNDYLQMMAECGIFAGSLFLALWAWQWWRLRLVVFDEPDDNLWRLTLFASLMAFSLVMLVSFPMQRPYGRLFFFFLLALGESRGLHSDCLPSVAAGERV